MEHQKEKNPILRFKDSSNIEFSDWKEFSLEECLKFGSGKDYKHLGEGDIPVYGTGGYMTSVNEFLYNGESVGIGRKGSIDKPIYLTGKFWTVDTLFYTHSFNGVLPYFIYLIFQKINWIKYNEASGVPSLSKSTLRKIQIKLPSLPEQQKIADFLSAVDKKIELLIRKKELLEQYKKGVMQKLFSQEIRFRDEEGRSFPEWERVRLGDVANIVGGGTPDTSEESYWNGEINWFTPTEIKGKYLTKSKRTISQKGLKNSSAKLLPTGTILFTSRATIGDVGFAMIECSTNQGFQSLVVNPEYSSEFIYQLVLYKKKEFLRKAQGSTFIEISSKTMKKMRFNIPVLQEQDKIADFLSSIDKKIELVQNQIKTTQTFKKGLLQQMFV